MNSVLSRHPCLAMPVPLHAGSQCRFNPPEPFRCVRHGPSPLFSPSIIRFPFVFSMATPARSFVLNRFFQSAIRRKYLISPFFSPFHPFPFAFFVFFAVQLCIFIHDATHCSSTHNEFLFTSIHLTAHFISATSQSRDVPMSQRRNVAPSK